jgi:pseudouridine-5'-phosphate glycosidase
MTTQNALKLMIADDIREAVLADQPVVALESTVITHGLPYPENYILARDMEMEIRQEDALPATIGVLHGEVRIGLTDDQLAKLAREPDVHKISSRDFGPACVKGWSGGTTVAGTLLAANLAGIKVFATGGIGGVHRQMQGPPDSARMDISADLPQLAATPLIVVCAGAKAILDLPATVETLETWGVPVIGYRTPDFPAFYSISSGLPVSAQAESPAEVAAIAKAHWETGMRSAVLVVNPPPGEAALPKEQVAAEIEQALRDAETAGVSGQQVTPFLLQRMLELTGGESLRANLALLKNNARLAAKIAVRLNCH